MKLRNDLAAAFRDAARMLLFGGCGDIVMRRIIFLYVTEVRNC